MNIKNRYCYKIYFSRNLMMKINSCPISCKSSDNLGPNRVYPSICSIILTDKNPYETLHKCYLKMTLSSVK